MKVYVGTDLEGVAGVVSRPLQTGPEGRYYDAARKLLTGEVNAAVEGLLEAGADDILVWDGHGPGAISFEDLHPVAKLLHGRPNPPREVWDEVIREYDVCMLIGQHAMAGTARGTLNHTQNSRTIDYIKLNGKPIGEIAQFALYNGALGVPMIFLSGDDEACREAKELIPQITTVSVKRGLGGSCAISLSTVEAGRRIREGVKAAIQREKENAIAPPIWEGPYVLEKRFFRTETADAAAAIPGAERVDSQTVRFTSDDIKNVIYR